jgi:hypothetical protein
MKMNFSLLQFFKTVMQYISLFFIFQSKKCNQITKKFKQDNTKHIIQIKLQINLILRQIKLKQTQYGQAGTVAQSRGAVEPVEQESPLARRAGWPAPGTAAHRPGRQPSSRARRRRARSSGAGRPDRRRARRTGWAGGRGRQPGTAAREAGGGLAEWAEWRTRAAAGAGKAPRRPSGGRRRPAGARQEAAEHEQGAGRHGARLATGSNSSAAPVGADVRRWAADSPSQGRPCLR